MSLGPALSARRCPVAFAGVNTLRSETTRMPARVVVCGSGGVGAIAIAAALDSTALELVGVWVHDPKKTGVDAATLISRPAIGVHATGSYDDLIALQPDCAIYCASGEGRPVEAREEIARMLAAGINVVTTSIPALVFPRAHDAKEVAELERACEVGRSTLYASGIEPGFAGDHLVLVLTTMSRTITSVRTQELFTYTDYPVSFTMFEVFGFGKPMEHQCLMELPGVQTSVWAAPIRFVAHHLGVELDEICETYEKRITPRRLEVAAGVIEAGTVGAVRFETIGVVDGRDAIIIEHINRMASDLAPDWPTADRDGTYRIEIHGEPDLTCSLQVGAEATFSHDGMIATTMRIVNAIPAVIDGPPGIVTATDLPLTLPTDAFRSNA